MVDIIEGYETEEQQVDAIKQWWKDNGTTLIAGAVIGLAGLWGWRYYGESVLTGQEQASLAFTEAVVKLESEGSDEMEVFIANNQSNNYGTLAALLLAKEAVKNQDFMLAQAQLTDLLAHNQSPTLTPVIKLRLARVTAELGEYEQAISILDKITETGFAVKMNQSKGAVYLAQGDNDAARKAFQAAIRASEGRVDPLLQLQLDDLAIADVADEVNLDAVQLPETE